MLNLHVALIGRRPKLDLAKLAPVGGSIAESKQGERPVYAELDGIRRFVERRALHHYVLLIAGIVDNGRPSALDGAWRAAGLLEAVERDPRPG